MNTLIYKRTHRGDPDGSGLFGARDCMGKVRGDDFDAVICVGGKSSWLRDKDLAYKINWIGVNPKKTETKARGWRGPVVEFERFVPYDQRPCNGPELKDMAPKLFKYMFEDKNVRHVMSRSLTNDIQQEIRKILELAGKNRGAKRFRSGWKSGRLAHDSHRPAACKSHRVIHRPL